MNGPKVTKLDWQVAASMERIVADLTFDNFEQSMRFVNHLITFIREERSRAEASQSAEASAGEHETPQQGKVSSETQEPGRADGQRSEQADTGSVT